MIVARFVGIAAVVAVIILSASFLLFVNDELSNASEGQQQLIEGSAGSTGYQTDENGRKLQRGDLRKRIDRVSDALTGPVDSLVEDKPNRWVRRGVPYMIALAFWGLGGLFLARYLRTIR